MINIHKHNDFHTKFQELDIIFSKFILTPSLHPTYPQNRNNKKINKQRQQEEEGYVPLLIHICIFRYIYLYKTIITIPYN